MNNSHCMHDATENGKRRVETKSDDRCMVVVVNVRVRMLSIIGRRPGSDVVRLLLFSEIAAMVAYDDAGVTTPFWSVQSSPHTVRYTLELV